MSTFSAEHARRSSMRAPVSRSGIVALLGRVDTLPVAVRAVIDQSIAREDI